MLIPHDSREMYDKLRVSIADLEACVAAMLQLQVSPQPRWMGAMAFWVFWVGGEWVSRRWAASTAPHDRGSSALVHVFPST